MERRAGAKPMNHDSREGSAAGAVNYDLNSSEDLVRLIESPMFPFVDTEITPLVDVDVVRKVQTKK